MEICKLQLPAGSASPATSASNLSSASYKLLVLTFPPIPTTSISLPPSQMDGPTRPCKRLPGFAEPWVCMGTFSTPWPSSQSKGFDEAWLTGVLGSPAWEISAPLLHTKMETEVCPDLDTSVVLVRDHLIGNEGVCHPSFVPGGHFKCSVTQACTLFCWRFPLAVTQSLIPSQQQTQYLLMCYHFSFSQLLQEKKCQSHDHSLKLEKPELAVALLQSGLQNQGRAAPETGKPQLPCVNTGSLSISACVCLQVSEAAGKLFSS